MIAPQQRSARAFEAAPSSRRKSSLGVPLSSLIFPRSAADRHESIRVTRAMEEKYGFHYLTNTFCLNALVELDFRAYHCEMNLLPACYASVASWLLWLVLSVQHVFALMSDNLEARAVAKLELLISTVVFVPVPLLVGCTRFERFRGHEQTLLCIIVHCFAVAVLASGVLTVFKEYRAMMLHDMEHLLDTFATSSAEKANGTDASAMSAALASAQVFTLDGEVKWWSFEDVKGTARALIVEYLDNGTPYHREREVLVTSLLLMPQRTDPAVWLLLLNLRTYALSRSHAADRALEHLVAAASAHSGDRAGLQARHVPLHIDRVQHVLELLHHRVAAVPADHGRELHREQVLPRVLHHRHSHGDDLPRPADRPLLASELPARADSRRACTRVALAEGDHHQREQVAEENVGRPHAVEQRTTGFQFTDVEGDHGLEELAANRFTLT